MTDEIFDYFGDSPRKVDPVEKDDFFEDLMPKHEVEEEPTAAPVIDDPVDSDAIAEDDEIVEAELVSVGKKSAPVEQVDLDGDDEDFDMESHWDSLATSLGLEAAAKPRVFDDSSETEVPPETVASWEKAEDSVDQADTGDDSFGIEVDADSRPDESNKDAFTELFVPDDRESDDDGEDTGSPISGSSVVEAFDDDPFAAFHRPVKTENDVQAKQDEVAEEPKVEDEPHLIVGDDFVEFEVKEFDRGEKSRESQRQRRGRGRGRGRSPDREQSDTAPREREDRNERNKTDESRRGEEVEPRRRKKRRRNQETEAREEQSESVSRESRQRKRPRRDREETGDDGDSGASRKKPKIPTWDDAISGVVEKNIKRHKSGSGKGGRRRRH